MQEMLIRYNPYRLETMILVDNEVPPKRSKLHFEDRRLQEWIEELPEIVFDEYRTRKFKITFYGTVLDFEDVEFMKDKALKHGFDIELEHIPAQEVTDKENCITEIFNENSTYELWAYNIETIMAEKLETILSRGITNTRPRDYYDVYILEILHGHDKTT